MHFSFRKVINALIQLKNIKIEHDGQGDNAGWYIESVEVKVNQEAYA